MKTINTSNIIIGGSREIAGGSRSTSSRGGNNGSSTLKYPADGAPSAPARRGSTSTAATRAASSPSGSPYLEAGFQRGGQSSRRGRPNGSRGEGVNAEDSRQSSGVSGGGGRWTRDSGHQEGRGGRIRAPPSTAPSAIEIDRLPSIGGSADTNTEEVGARDEGGPSLALRPRWEGHPGCSQTESTTERCRLPGKDAPGLSSTVGGERSQKEHTYEGGGRSGGGRSETGFDSGRREIYGVGVGVGSSGDGGQAGRSCAGVSRGGMVGDSSDGRREWLVGLQNLGNTCFMNACLQCLLHTDALIDLFRRRVHEQRLCDKSPTGGALAAAFGELVDSVEESPAHSSVSPGKARN